MFYQNKKLKQNLFFYKESSNSNSQINPIQELQKLKEAEKSSESTETIYSESSFEQLKNRILQKNETDSDRGEVVKRILELIADHDGDKNTDSWNDYGVNEKSTNLEIEKLLNKLQDQIYSHHVVLEGDSLHSISQKYNLEIDQLIRLNPTTATNPDLIFPGQEIRFREKKDSQVKHSNTQGNLNLKKIAFDGIQSAVTKFVESFQTTKYIVKPGDDLEKIASDNSTTVEHILQLNTDITNPDLIFPGQEIRFREKIDSQVKNTDTQANLNLKKIAFDDIQSAVTKFVESFKTKKYIVKPGDDLEKIASDNSTTVEHILQLNTDITNPDLIFPGQEILIKNKVQVLNPKNVNSNISEVSKPPQKNIPQTQNSSTFNPNILPDIVEMTTGYNMQKQFYSKPLSPVTISKLSTSSENIDRLGDKKPYKIKLEDGTIKKFDLYKTYSGGQYLDEHNNQYYLNFDNKENVFILKNYSQNRDYVRFVNAPEGAFLIPSIPSTGFDDTRFKLASGQPHLEVIGVMGTGFIGAPGSKKMDDSAYKRGEKLPIGYHWDKISKTEYSEMKHMLVNITRGYYNYRTSNGKVETRFLDIEKDLVTGKILTPKERMTKIDALKIDPNVLSISIVGKPTYKDNIAQNRSLLVFGENGLFKGQAVTPPMMLEDLEPWARQKFGAKSQIAITDGDFFAKSYIPSDSNGPAQGEEIVAESGNAIYMVKPVDRARAAQIMREAAFAINQGADEARQQQYQNERNKDLVSDATNLSKIASKFGIKF